RSTLAAPEFAKLKISSLLPTAAKRPSAIAIAPARGLLRSIVNTLALNRTICGSVRRHGGSAKAVKDWRKLLLDEVRMGLFLVKRWKLEAGCQSDQRIQPKQRQSLLKELLKNAGKPTSRNQPLASSIWHPTAAHGTVKLKRISCSPGRT